MYQSMFHLDYLWLNDFNVGLGTGELGYIRIRMWVGLIIFSGKVLYISTDINFCDWLRLANTDTPITNPISYTQVQLACHPFPRRTPPSSSISICFHQGSRARCGCPC